ncbi:alpha/beta hydrolase [Companilactobacillus hulinensis]|uniref:alpha/beta hydrolase n=1 Tax=Companilactobacillus hulinensis TaxID=2486007 RepID=UPI000F7751F4|nr:alpha/beta hydrolase [Companilactobacillus hulinensis]
MNTQKLMYKDTEFVLDTYWLDPISDFTSTVKHPVVIICPGGGFTFHSDREAQPIALKFASEGVHALVLHYQLITNNETVYPLALQELATTLNWLKSQADIHLIDLNKIILIGFSAGGQIVANYNSLMTDPETVQKIFSDPIEVQPKVNVLCYSVIDLTLGYPDSTEYAEQISSDKIYWSAQEHLTSNSKPTFIWQTVDDETVPVLNSITYAQKLNAIGIPYELHLFGSGRHGLSLASRVTQHPGEDSYVVPADAKWWELCINWLKLQKVLPN